ncbi:MAG TPA: indolepyruvate oxidoreductase subunit beta [Prolixibacteraceae bacterium]|nr:indolepyruvate oxidoreductase subunit beta [Prolixibacteraceae bacterium]HPS13082.1 indolepyruvate oxidoreductase subunit beta [Prolixibacteraceae bacterium]
MKKDIILAGVGGQGILSIASVIDFAALSIGYHVKQAEVHGMSQRGGAVQSNLRISDSPIYSDLIPLSGADLIISVEPMESLRYIPYLNDGGWVITSKDCFKNIPNYPDEHELFSQIEKLPHSIAVEAEHLAREAGSAKASNIVMLGVAAPFLGISVEKLKEAIVSIFSEKGQKIIDINLKAFDAGLACSKK